MPRQSDAANGIRACYDERVPRSRKEPADLHGVGSGEVKARLPMRFGDLHPGGLRCGAVSADG